jgi:CubicO group peptidase (beta-lactamase class C family)
MSHSENAIFEQLGEYITDKMKKHHVPGVAVGVQHEGKEYTAGFGVTNVNHPLAVDGDTLFQIGSITKTFTATTAMRLVEMGKLELDTPIREYLPDFRMADPDVTARVTMRHLFTHVGGWLGDYFDDFGNGDDALAKYVAHMAELPQLTPLGTVWSYNNAAFSLAGRVIEAVSGKTYEAALTELVLKPLDLNHTFIMPTDVMTHRFATGHIVRDEEPVVATPWPLARSAHAAGALTSTVKDQLRYARFHSGDGTAGNGVRVLKPESIKHMQTRITTAALGEEMGLAWFMRVVYGTRIVRHTGGTNGQLSVFLFAPNRGFAFSLLTNADTGAELYRSVTQWALEHYFGIAEPTPAHIVLGVAELANYAGHYTTSLNETELYVQDGQLMMQLTPKGGFPYKDSPANPTPPPTRLAFVGTDRVVALDAPSTDVQGEFLRNAGGRIEWFRFGSRIKRRVE